MKTLFDGVDRLEGALTFHRARHAVLAGNVANVDTPGYRPFDLAAQGGELNETGLAPATTAAGHISNNGSLDGANAGGRLYDDAGPSAGADGNFVDLERELAKVDANRVRYAGTAELVSRKLAMLRYAATDGQG